MIDTRLYYKIKHSIIILLTSALIFLLLLYPAVETLAAKSDQAVTGETIKARLELKEKGPYYVGDSISVNLIVEGASGTEYLLPEFEPRQLGGLELAAKDQVKREELKGSWKHTITYRFLGWRAGEYKISGLAVNYQDQAGNEGSAKVKEIQIKITTLLPANLSEEELLADGLKSLKKPVGLPPRYQYFWVLIGGLGLIGLVYWLLKYWQRSNRNQAVASVEQDSIPVEPSHLIALRRLEDLHRKQLLEDGAYKLFYDQLSEITREYIENRFRIRALEMTTEEFLIGLGKMDLLNFDQKTALAVFLQYSDLVKFAKHQPVREEGEKALAIIYSLIEETKEEVEVNDI